MRKLRYQSDHKIVLSGTPDDGDPAHYWGQFRFFAPDVFGDRWGDFDSEYLLETGYMGYKRKFDLRKTDKFHSMISPWILVITNEVLNLKEPRHVRVPIEMPRHLRKKYDQMENHLVVELRDQILAAQLPVTKTVKLQQLASGFIYDEERNTHRISNFRTRRLEPIFEKHSKEPMVIFCKYIPEMRSIASLCKRKGLRYAYIRGGSKFKKQRPQVQRDFQDGKYDVVICQIRSGVGIDLYKSHVAIFYSTGHSSIDFQQSKARVYRRGQEEQVVYYYLVVKNSVDEDIQLALKDKRSVSKSLLERMKARLNRRKTNGKDPKSKS
jgi:SNF2 family DNA or RNA helicase